jgi:hypothetical protein
VALRITKREPRCSLGDSAALVLLAIAVGCGGSTSSTKNHHQIVRRGNCPAEREDGAYDLDAAQVAARRGTHDKTFADTPSTQATPLQVCGLHGELAYLTRVTCADGSRPWTTAKAAHAGRKGAAMTPGVGCARPVDAYVAPCTERAYEVFFDMYQCGPGEELWRDAGV